MVIKIMASNSDLGSEDIEFMNENCPVAILNAIPTHCQKVLFAQLKTSVNYKDKAIVGKLCQINPLGKRANGYIRKLQVTDALSPEESQKKLTVFLLDKFAQDSEAAHLDGFLIITNFLLEKSTHCKDDELPFQILVKNEESQVLFGKKVPTPASKSSTKSKKAISRKRMKAQSEDESHQILANHYDYTSIGILQETEPKFYYNIYGIVDNCKLKVTQGQKKTHILDLLLTDETETGFMCSVFAAKDETFPDIYPGDIIRIHRMQVYKFRSKLKGRCCSPNFILVFSKEYQGSRPRTVAKSFTFTPEDSARVEELFEWYKKKCEPKLISEINRGDFANIVCQVIGVYCARTTEAVILKIWDGTRTNQFENSHWGLKEEILDEKLFLIARSYYVVLSVYGQHVAAAAELKPGQFIEVRDAHLYSPKTNPDDCKLCLHTGTKEDRGIRVLDVQDERVKKLQERLHKIIVDTQNIGNDTDDLLSENNSVFLNCDISQLTTSSQRTSRNEEDAPGFQTSLSQRPNTNNEINVDVQTSLNQRPTANGEMNLDVQPSLSQRSTTNNEINVDVAALNAPLSSRVEEATSTQNTVISVVEAAIKPGQCTQEFGESTQRDLQEMDISEENRVPGTSEIDPVLNKTPVEFRMFLHNPSASGRASPTFFPITNDSEDDWWNSVPTVSETEGHSAVKPSTLSEVLSQEVPHQFRILCAVLSYEPQRPSMLEMIHLFCPKCLYMTKDAAPTIEPFEERDGLFYFYCPDCRTTEAHKEQWPILMYTFLISLDLHDGVGPSNLKVLLWKEEAVRFFKGILPEDALRDASAAEQVFRMLWSICPNCRPFNANQMREQNYTGYYPTLDCCVISYTTADGPKYQMFDTKMK